MTVALVSSASKASPMQILVEDYLTGCRARGLAPGTISTSYGYPLLHVLLPWCREHEIERPDQLTTRMVDSLSVDLMVRPGKKGRPISKFTHHSYTRAIRGFLNWCEREGEGAAARPSLPRLPRRVLDILSRDEISRLEAAATSERDRIIIRILGDCGLRAAELCNLGPEDLIRHDRQGYLKVKGKGGRERLVPLQPALFRRIDRYIRETRSDEGSPDVLFLSLRKGRSGEYERLTRSGLFQLIEHAAIVAGMEGRHVHPHLLRHSFITNALRAGVNPIILSQIAGHTSTRMIEQVYSHLDAGDGYEALMKALAANP